MDANPLSYKIEPVGYFDTEHLKTGLRIRALKGASLTVAGQITSFFVQTVGTLLLARLLTPHDFGLITMVLTISLLLQNLGCNGFIEAVVQKEQVNHEQISTLFWINATLALLLTLVFLMLSPAIAWFYKEPALKPIAAVMAISIFMGGLSNQHISLLMKNMQFSKITGNEVVSSTISIAIAIVLAIWGWGYWALVAKWVLSPVLLTLGAWILCRWRPGLPSRGTGIRPMLRYAFHTYGNFVVTYFRRNLDKILVGRFIGVQQLGFYERAYQLANMLPSQIVSPLNGVSMATFSRLASQPETYRRSYLKVLAILAFVGMPLSAGLTLSSPDVIRFLLGPKWATSVTIFCAFGPSIGIAILYVTHGWLHLSLGTPDRWFRWSIIELAVTILCFAAGLKFGGLGVAISFSVSFYLLLWPALWYAGKPIHLRFGAIISVIWKYFSASLAAGLISWFFLYRYPWTSGLFFALPLLVRLATSFLVIISLYLALIVVLFAGPTPIVHFGEILREMILKDRNHETNAGS